MGLFDFLKKSPAAEPDAPTDPIELRDAVFDAAGSGDVRTLKRLVDARADLIVASFPDWSVIPDPATADPGHIQWLGSGLVALAQYFAEHRDDPSLLQSLSGTAEGTNPIQAWQDAMDEADGLRAEGDWAAARTVVEGQLEAVRGLRGGASETMLAMTLVKIGQCHFAVGQIEEAIEPFHEALELYRTAEDLQGEHGCLGSLGEIFLYLGESDQAGDFFAEQAELLREAGIQDQADQTQARADRERAGTPLNRVVAVLKDIIYEIEDVPTLGTTSVQFVFQRNRPSLPACTRAVAEGMDHGTAARYFQAAEAFESASALDPLDPQPHYQLGVTRLHQERWADAVAAFDACEALGPGWFHVRADRWIAHEIAEGRLAPEAFAALRSMETDETPKAKLRLAEGALESVGRFPHLELQLGRQYETLGKMKDARRVWEAALDPTPEPDVRTRIYARLGVAAAKETEAAAWFEKALAVEDGNLVAQASARLALR